MFETITIRPNKSRNHAIDIGQIMENLLFYDKTIVHIGRNEISNILEYMDTGTFETLLNRPEISVRLNNSHSAIGFSPDKTYFADVFGIKDVDVEKILHRESLNVLGGQSSADEFAKCIAPLIQVHELPKTFSSSLKDELLNDSLRMKILEDVVNFYNPYAGFSSQTSTFNVKYIDDYYFKIDTNIDFSEFHNVDETTVILALLNACEDIQVIAENSSEISLPDINSILVQNKINDLVLKSTKAAEKINHFNHLIYNNSISLREAINEKTVSISEVLPILDKAAKFKEWLRHMPADANLLSEYIAKISEKSFLEKLPAKAIRFYLVTGLSTILKTGLAGVSGILSGIALSAFNSFVLDKLIKDWKPNQFIETDLKPLLK